MAKRNYQDKLNNINTWVEIVNYHWHRLESNLFNDEEFWNDTLHAMQDQDWWDWVEIAPALKIQHSDVWRKYPKLAEGTKEVERLLMLGKPVTKKDRKGKNFEAFRLLMNIKDFINDVNGTPTKQFVKEPEPKQEQPTAFERLFDLSH